MAAYAALVSILQIVDHLEKHPHPPISLDKKQVESLTKNVTFLQDFLESYPHLGENEEGQAMEGRIADAAYAAEDVIESEVVDRILVESTNYGPNIEFCRRLQKVIDDMEYLIKNDVIGVKEKMGVQRQLRRSSASHSSGHNATMVGFEEALLEMLNKVVGEKDALKTIPIVGMGGIGKTTLARNVYSHPLIEEHFYIRAWVTVSQEFNTRSILSEVLCQAKQSRESSSAMDENEIGEDLYKYLSGRRYLIIMDDMWSIEAWDKIKFFFPDYRNGSRIVVTTRLSNLARDLPNSYGLSINLLGKDKSWDLFSKIVFGDERCPPDLEAIGKKIVANCRGLPLSIVVIGGFLAKSGCEREQWEHIEKNMKSIVNSENDEHCLQILQLSYNQLPVHLKPCFLYMGVFKEDSATRISDLVKIWVAEGFLKPIKGKDLEEIAKEYLMDLVDRNLVSITTARRRKCAKIHDLLRELCHRQAQTERFYSVVRHKHSVNDIAQDIQSRRFVMSETLKKEVRDGLLSTPLARSIIMDWGNFITPWPPDLRLLRIFRACNEFLYIEDPSFQEHKFQLVNLRYFGILRVSLEFKFAASFNLFWNLQTLIIRGADSDKFTAPAEIWTLPQLRHVQVSGSLILPDPPVCNGQDDIVLENLQTLMTVRNFKCSEEVIKKFPNIKNLAIQYMETEVGETHLNNLERLNKLKSFHIFSFPHPMPDWSGHLQSLTFPESLKKLALTASHVHWEDMLGKIGSLPLLRKLTISGGYFRTGTWETVEGQFLSLRLLVIENCEGLKDWSSESSHFPRLEHLFLDRLRELNGIPSDIGEIQTLP